MRDVKIQTFVTHIYIYAGIYIKIHFTNSKIIKCDLQEREIESHDMVSMNSHSAEIRIILGGDYLCEYNQ